MQVRAYSTLDLKALETDRGKRVFSGVASTPTTDRAGDIVEPSGAEFTLPLPFLWQHDSWDPIGWITAAKVSENKGIVIDGEVATIEEEGTLKQRLDLAWQMLKAKLVRGLSIGFQSLEAARIGDTYSYRYIKWAWYELSAVTIPANAECSITSIKSADLAMRRASLGKNAPPVVRLDNPAPGVSGARREGVIYLH